MLEIKEQLIPLGSERRSGTKMTKVVFFVDHDTGNDNSTAKNNADNFVNHPNALAASAHIFIDDREAIMCVPCLENPEKAWHVLYGKPKDNVLYGDDANDIAIGLELCYFSKDKARTQKAYNHYIEIAAYLCNYHQVDPAKRSGHFELDPQRRTDPSNALKYIGKTYKDMKADIVAKYNELYRVKEDPVVAENEKIVVPDWAKEAWAWSVANGINDGKVDSVEEIRTMCYLFRYHQKFSK